MSPAPRSVRRRNWPRGLQERRPGYFSWKHPDGRELAIGRVPLEVAKSEALAANLHLADTRPGLVERLTGAGQTVADLLDKMPAGGAINTIKTRRSQDKAIRAAIGARPVGLLSVADIAGVFEPLADAGKMRGAQALRSRLIAVCRRGQQLGWMESNPAEVTGDPAVTVKRGRLTLDLFLRVYEHAPAVAEWLPQAMRLALVTGQDRSTIAGLQRAMVADGYLTTTRSKTGARRAIPLALRLDCVGWTLADLVAQRTGVVSKHLVHHVNPWGNAPAGSPVHPDTISRSFTEARTLAGIPDVGPDGKGAPTFHEIRSLCKRLYKAQGGVDTKALLGHLTDRMGDLYEDPRGAEAVVVRISGGEDEGAGRRKGADR